MGRFDMIAKMKAMKAQLTTLATRECDNCQERDCASCWAIEYFKGE
jgi:hypothetical protein